MSTIDTEHMEHSHLRPGQARPAPSAARLGATVPALAFGSSDLRLIADALHEYAESCQLAAEMAAGRDEQRRQRRAAESVAAQHLLASIRGQAAA